MKIEISKIAIKTETFCTAWHGKLYCVDICVVAEERSAYNLISQSRIFGKGGWMSSERVKEPPKNICKS